MKYPFYKKSFWIILSSLALLSLLISYDDFRGAGISDGAYWAVPLARIFVEFGFFIAIAFVADYLGHLIFSKPEKK